MSELWTPSTSEVTDVTNIFDMMIVFQDQLELIGLEGGQKAEWFPVAVCAVKSLAHHLSLLSDEERSIQVSTEYTWVEAIEGLRAYERYGEVGLRGTMVDVHGSLEFGGTVPQISVAMFANTMYSLEDPDVQRDLQLPAITPITKVRSIEHVAV